MLRRLCFQGLDNWKGLYIDDEGADEPVRDEEFKEELTKTGYLIQAAYSYLDVNKNLSPTMGLPMVSAFSAAWYVADMLTTSRAQLWCLE